MRWTILTLCVVAAACSGRDLNSPTSPTGAGLSQNQSGGSQTEARQASELPFHGSFSRESSAVFEPPITLVITASESGTATELGRFTATSANRVNTTNNTAVGTLRFTAANGDQLWTATEGRETSFIPPNVSMVTANARIVGGTGRFVGATGTFTIWTTETIDFAANSAIGTGSFDGRITLNR